MITKPILLVSPKPAFFFGSQDHGFRVTQVLFAKAKPTAICEGGKGMREGECPRTSAKIRL